eukprot:TRINITY_DN29764_c0_g1_i1.p1 TRINITY_DN29764_c0_g1~~TRINITY_DN29764_c0_g1_i1.p1  ORF type:complete len:445 (+),score=49.65 TRINITY_DN29764_c0_g1_i1:63-1397(+)
MLLVARIVVLALLPLACRTGIPLDPRLAGRDSSKRVPLETHSYFFTWTDSGAPLFVEVNGSGHEAVPVPYTAWLHTLLLRDYLEMTLPPRIVNKSWHVHRRKQHGFRVGEVEDDRCWMNSADFHIDLLVQLCDLLPCNAGMNGPRVLNFGAHDGFGLKDPANRDPLAELVIRNSGIDGLYFEPDADKFLELVDNMRDRPGLELVNLAAGPENLERLLGRATVFQGVNDKSVDIVKVDIDSYDCTLIQHVLSHVSAKVVVMEVDHAIPPPIKCVRLHGIPYIPGPRGQFLINGGDYRGCSLSYAVSLLASLGYLLLRFNGNDAAFIHKDMESRIQAAFAPNGLPMDEFHCYRLMDYEDLFAVRPGGMEIYLYSFLFPPDIVQDWFFTGSADETLERVRGNLSMFSDIVCDLRMFPSSFGEYVKEFPRYDEHWRHQRIYLQSLGLL